MIVGHSEDEKLGDFEFLFIIEILLLGPKNCYESFLNWYIFLNRINSDWQKTKECRKIANRCLSINSHFSHILE